MIELSEISVDQHIGLCKIQHWPDNTKLVWIIPGFDKYTAFKYVPLNEEYFGDEQGWGDV